MRISFEHLIEFWEFMTKRKLNEKEYWNMSYNKTDDE
jgi:hypothetical protein